MPNLTLRTAKHRLLIGLILLVGAVVSVGVWAYVKSTEEARINAEFNRRAEVLAQTARDQIRLHAELVRGIRAHLENSPPPDAAQFDSYCATITARLPAASVFQWVPRVTHAERGAFEAAAARRLPGYRLWEREVSGDGRTAAIPARPREEYWPILLLSPSTGHDTALGYDISASRITRPMLDAARRLRTLQLSPLVPLLYDPAKPRGDGVIFIEPVFRPDAAGAAPDGFVGFIQAIFRIEVLLGEALAANADPTLDFTFIDHSAFNSRLSLLYAWRNGRPAERTVRPVESGPEIPEANPVAPETHAAGSLSQVFEIGGRTWRLIVAKNPAWPEGEATYTPLFALLTWLALTVLVALFARHLLARTDRIKSEVAARTAELTESKRQLDSLMAALPGVAFRLGPDPAHPTLYASAGVVDFTGYPPSDYLDGVRHFREHIHADDVAAVRAATNAAVASRREFESTYRLTARDGTEKWALSRGRGVYAPDGALRFIEGLAIDITAQKTAEGSRLAIERKLLDTQKLESLGLLAGGIAHDFNNLLSVILGRADLARALLPNLPGEGAACLGEIENAAVRAAELCTQLLAYAGKGRFTVEPTDLNFLLNGMRSLLRVSVGQHAALRFELGIELPAVMADAAQIRQIGMNLITNAAEAIGERRGEIVVSTGVRSVDTATIARAVAGSGNPPGDYVYVDFRDNGPGMGPEVLARIFDPFFTTKFTGRGLGLAAVLGIVRGHHGALLVASTPGSGTTFTLLLPPATTSARSSAAPPDLPVPESARVLVVDDDDSVRPLVAAMLASIGCIPKEAPDGNAAVTAFKAAPADFDLVVLDLLMPGLSGEETLVELRRIRADVRVLIISGYNEGGILGRHPGGGPLAYLAKPFTRNQLAQSVHAILA